VIPILWDDVGPDPDYNSFAGAQVYPNPFYGTYRNLYGLPWVRQPGDIVLQNYGTYQQLLMDYVTMVVTAAVDYEPCVLLWDVWNEPALDSQAPHRVQKRDLILSTLGWIKNAQPDAKTTVSMILTWDTQNSLHTSIANDTRLDVLSVHPYGYFREDIGGFCASTLFAGKPVLVTECGMVGAGQAYHDLVSRLRNANKASTGYQTDGVGFTIFMSQIGQPSPDYGLSPTVPFSRGNGLFYHPTWDSGGIKYVRDTSGPAGTLAISTLAAAAAADGYSVTPVNFQPMLSTAPGYVAPDFLPDGFDAAAILAALNMPYSGSTPASVLLRDGNIYSHLLGFSFFHWRYNYYQAGISAAEYASYLGYYQSFIGWSGVVDPSFLLMMTNWQTLVRTITMRGSLQ